MAHNEMAPSEAAADVPSHVGIIMDGNRRWAKRQGLAATKGHEEGLNAAKAAVRAAAQTGVRYLSLYTFSTENWQRGKREVKFLLNLVRHLRDEYDFYREYGVRIVHSGDIAGLPEEVRNDIRQTVEDTREHSRIVCNLAINYGGRYEILSAVHRMYTDGSWDGSSRPEADILEAHFDQPELPPLDMVIRTGNRYRLSNFFIWQAAYAELVFMETLWPDWTEAHFMTALKEYQRRTRTFGGDS